MRTFLYIALPLILCVPGAAFAQGCGNLNTQAEMNQCALEAYRKVDGELNRVYNGYRARLDQDQQRRLKEVQLAWIRFRDLGCGFESAAVKGGSVYPLILNSCLAEMTRGRLRQLSALANCAEGDLSCPAWK